LGDFNAHSVSWGCFVVSGFQPITVLWVETALQRRVQRQHQFSLVSQSSFSNAGIWTVTKWDAFVKHSVVRNVLTLGAAVLFGCLAMNFPRKLNLFNTHLSRSVITSAAEPDFFFCPVRMFYLQLFPQFHLGLSNAPTVTSVYAVMIKQLLTQKSSNANSSVFTIAYNVVFTLA